MIEKYFDGSISKGIFEGECDEGLRNVALEVPVKVNEYMDKYIISNAMDEIWKLVGRVNKYIDETTPWALAKDEGNKERLKGVLYNLTESIRIISTLISPFMPETSSKINEQFGFSQEDTNWNQQNHLTY